MIPIRAKTGPDAVAGLPVVMIYAMAGVVVWAVATMLNSDNVLGDPDIWWHIRTGQWIWQNRALPYTDPFSHSFHGQPWFAKEWLSQLIYFAAYSAAAWNGVMLVSAAAVGLSVWVLYRAAAEELAPIPALTATIYALLMAFPALNARPHLLTLPLVIVWSHLLLRAAWRGEAPRPDWLLIIVLWANLHAGFTIGFVVAGFAFLDFIERHRSAWRELAPKWVVFLLLCPLMSMVHPYGWAPLLASWWAVFPAEKALAVAEWAPFDASVQLLAEVGLLAGLLMALLSGFRLGIARSLLLVLLLHLSLVHVRFFFYLAPVLPLLVVPEIARQFPRLSAEVWRAAPRDALEDRLIRYHRPVMAGLAGIVLLLALLQAVLPVSPSENASNASVFAFIERHGFKGNVLNDYDFGGPLIFHGIPTFIDGRSDQLFRANGFSLKYDRGPVEPAELAAAIKQYGITWTMLRPTDRRIPALNALPGWRRVFANGNAVIYQLGAPEPRTER